MTDKEKAEEIATTDFLSNNPNKPRHFYHDLYVGAMQMAEWKNEQFAKENKWIDVKDKLPQFVKTEYGIRRSKPVICKKKGGGYCVARCFRYKTEPHFWQDDNYEKLNVKFWKEIKD